MQHVLSLSQEAGEVVHVFRDVDLTGAGIRAIVHRLVEFFEGHGLSQIVGMIHAVHHKVKIDIVNISLLKMLFAQIRRRAAAENIIRHFARSLPFILITLYFNAPKNAIPPPLYNSVCRRRASK